MGWNELLFKLSISIPWNLDTDFSKPRFQLSSIESVSRIPTVIAPWIMFLIIEETGEFYFVQAVR